MSVLSTLMIVRTFEKGCSEAGSEVRAGLLDDDLMYVP